MPITHTPGVGTTITGSASINLFRLITLRSALSLEIKGIRVRRGFSAYATVKRELLLTGSKASVLAQLDRILDTMRATKGAQEVQ